MALAAAILKGISDKRQIVGHLAKPSPFKDLIEQYNAIALKDDDLPLMNERSTGAELKAAIGRVEPELQVTLLYKYSVATKTLDNPTLYNQDPVKLEERKLRIYLAKLMTTVFAVGFCLIVGAMVAISVKSGDLPNEGVVKSLMSTAGEIIKVILGSSGK